MPSFRRGVVEQILLERPGIQEVVVRVDGSRDRAYALTDLVGPVAVGEELILNTTAVDLGLGTGGRHFVHWNLARDSLEQPGPDHIMKMRYTSLQTDVGTSELVFPDIPDSLGATPVLACCLHSQMAVAAVTLADTHPELNVVYVMTDGAALPIALSELVHHLRSMGVLSGTVTAGNAFGGELEAVSLASGLLLAKHVAGADVILAAMGPGVVGTGTTFGTTAVEVAGIIDTTAALGSVVMAPRMSNADARERHRGLSHHSRTAARLAWVPFFVSSSLVAPEEFGAAMAVDVTPPDVSRILGESGLTITTMGRGVADDPPFFDAVVEAAQVAASLVPTP